MPINPKAARALLIGPRPPRSALTRTSQIPGMTPESGREALYAGTDRYISPKTGKETQVTELGNPARMNQAGDPLTAHGTKGVATRKRTRGGQLDDSEQALYKNPRERNIAQQTEGRNDFEEGFETEVNGQKFEAHHRAGLDQYAPFFKGLDKAERAQMRKYLSEIGLTGGNKRVNNYGLPKEVHDAFHNAWERSHSLKLKPDFFNNSTLKQRMEAAKVYGESIQEAYDEAAYGLMQGFNQGMDKDALLELAKSL